MASKLREVANCFWWIAHPTAPTAPINAAVSTTVNQRKRWLALAWSSARRGISTAVVAGVVGSFTYNVTMTLGVGALARPLQISDAASLHLPWVFMLGALGVVLVLAWPRRRLGRLAGSLCLTLYPVFVVAVLMN